MPRFDNIAQKDDMGAHARLYEQIAHSAAWVALSFSARALYMQLRVRLKATNNGNIEATMSALRHAGFASSSTLAKALRELETVGLIAKTRQGGVAAGGKLCSLYRFTDKPCHELPKQALPACKASHDWRAWTSVAAAMAAIRAAHASAKRPTSAGGPDEPLRKISVKVRKPKRIGSESGASGAALRSDIEQGGPSALRNLNAGRAAGLAGKSLL